jgi:hypothetical protein
VNAASSAPESLFWGMLEVEVADASRASDAEGAMALRHALKRRSLTLSETGV